jgi:lipid-A-disaccharide synthase
LGLLRRVRDGRRGGRYYRVILVDYRVSHWGAAAAARAAGVPVLYYIAPQLWAWGVNRAKRLASVVSRLAVILPFEEEFFRGRGVAATFVGHPLRDRPDPPGREGARRALGLDLNRPALGLFPGSRASEVRRLWPEFRAAAARVAAAVPGLQVIVAGVPGAEYPDAGEIQIHPRDPTLVFAAADAAICKAGTTTLEAAVADTPMVVAYRASALSALIARRVVRVPWVGLVNLVAGRAAAPELLQDDMRADRLAAAVTPLLDPASSEARRQREGLAEVRERLGSHGAAERVADLAAELLA